MLFLSLVYAKNKLRNKIEKINKIVIKNMKKY